MSKVPDMFIWCPARNAVIAVDNCVCCPDYSICTTATTSVSEDPLDAWYKAHEVSNYADLEGT